MELETQQQNNDFEAIRERAYRFIAMCEAYLQENSLEVKKPEQKK